jgi:pimeloyl-ACP methyl ester carboxylesterase
VSGLVVSGAGTNEPVFTDPWILDVQRRQAEAAQRFDAGAWIDAFLEALVIGPHRTADDVDPSVLARCREMVTDTVSHHVRPDAVTPTHVHGSWERLGEIDVPALGVYGTLDVSDHIAMAERFAAGVRHGSVVGIEGAGHLPNMERPAEFNAALLTFLATR